MALLLRGDDLSSATFDRLVRSRERALRQLDDPEWRLDIGAAKLNQAFLTADAGKNPDPLLHEARDALRQGLARKPAESTGWLWLAMVEARLEEWPAMTAALRLALLTTPFDPPNMVTRSSLGLLAWSRLDEATRPLVVEELRRTMARFPQELIMTADDFGRRRELRAAAAGDTALAAQLERNERRMRGLP